MAITLPNGAVTSIASSYGSAATVTAVSNANPATVTAAGHGFTGGEIIEITSGWSKLDGRIVRVTNVAADNFDLEGVDTSNTTKFPSGSGVGSIREVTAWTQITQIMGRQGAGGEPSFYTYKFEDDDTERQKKTGKSAKSTTLTIGDDQSLPHYNVLVEADEAGTNRAIRTVLPSGAIVLYNADVAFSKDPNMSLDEGMTNNLTLSYQSAVTRYAS